MTDIQQARAWAENGAVKVNSGEVIDEIAKAAVRVIQSLPDQWIDAERAREVISKVLANTIHGTVGRQVAEDYAALIGELMPAPSLQTLADMTPEERQACQWMQADLNVLGDTYRVVILNFVNERADCMRADGARATQRLEDITPLPDLPKLEWPGSHADTITAESVEDVQAGRVADFEPALPRPEDVPAEAPWIVLCGGQEWVGVRASGLDEHAPWTIIRMNGLGYRDVTDSEITLISRLVPEVKP